MRQQHLGGYDEYHDSPELMGEDRGEEYYRPQRRWPAGLLTVGAMAVFAGGIYFAYVQGTKHGAPVAPTADGVPLIRADDRPTKVKPDQPGGMAVPDQNVSLYNDKPGGPPVEKLLAGPEQPLPRPTAPPPPIPGPFAAAPAAPPQAPAPAAPFGAAPAEPQAAAAATKPAAKPGAPVKPAPAKEASGAKEAAAILGATPTAASASSATKATGSGPVRIQLGSLRSAEAAKEEWARLKREQPELLGKLSAVAVRADLGEKGIYYRVLAGPVADGAAAERLCGELKQRKLGCTLVR
jgi:cell division septation protein DedD